ncbi:MAG: dodecin family protein [Patescibacteria group bacterium]|nr:dodecin family protein [Patescibacteria group bacterium]
MAVVKIIELVSTSKKSFEDAIRRAVQRTTKTVRNVTGADVVRQKVVIKNGKIVEYRVNLKIAFVVE